MTPHLVVMDVGDVLITTSPMAQYKALAQMVGMTWQQVADCIEGAGLVAQLERGALDEDQFGRQVRQLLKRPGLSVGDIDHAWTCVIAGVEPIVAGAAAELAAHARLVLASNTNPIHWKVVHARLHDYGIEAPAMLSFQMGVAKPDPVFFTVLRRTYPHLDGAVYIDDRADNLAAAAQVGLAGRLHQDPSDTASYLRSLLA
ncbi:MAG: hypothetical protein ACRCYU_05995 [Nocardioides sp.]